jgi:DNA-binding winged helix-turn-helix (wHTH) protein
MHYLTEYCQNQNFMLYSGTNMQNIFPPVVTKQYLEEAPKWLGILKKGESASIMFFPKMDRLRRINQLLEDTGLLKKHLGTDSRYILQHCDFSTVNIEDVYDMQETLTKQLNFSHIAPANESFDKWMSYLKRSNIRLCLFLYEGEKYMRGPGSILPILSQLTSKFSPQMTVLGFFEVNIMHPEISSHLPADTTLYDNIFTYPLYNEEDAIGFVDYLEEKWSLTIPTKLKRTWYARYGGHFWLLKEAVRHFSMTGEWEPDETGLRFRTEKISSGLSVSELSVIEKLGRKEMEFSPDEKISLAHLTKLNAIDSGGTVLIPALSNYIASLKQNANTFTVSEGSIVLNSIPITSAFSRKERRALSLLIERTPDVVTRDDIAARIWPVNTEKYYSDWAIDQIVARIRTKLKQFSLPPKTIQALRGKGYIFRV